MKIDSSLGALLDALNIAGAVFDTQHRVVIWTRRLGDFTAISPGAALGQNLQLLLPGLDSAGFSRLTQDAWCGLVMTLGDAELPGAWTSSFSLLPWSRLDLIPLSDATGGVTHLLLRVVAQSPPPEPQRGLCVPPARWHGGHAADELIEQFEKSQQQLQSEKLAGIGQLAAGVAHEINNPVGYVHSNLNTLRDYVRDLLDVIEAIHTLEPLVAGIPAAATHIRELRQRLDLDYLKNDLGNLITESLEGVNRVKQIVQSLKDFSHIDDGTLSGYDLNNGIETTLKLANHEIKYKAKVRCSYGNLPIIQCLPSQINQVILNLLLNAAQAIDKDGLIQIRTGADEGGAWLEVEDNGAGIASEHLSRLFEPFFSTKPVGKGTGLGLALSYRIIKKHNGEISVKSQPGSTCFRVWLPIDQGQPA